MLILNVTYVKPIEEVEPHMEAHMAWVNEGYDRGWFLASGRKQPRTGGAILAVGDRGDIEAFLALDPFVTSGVAEYDVTELVLSRVSQGLEKLKG